MGKVILGWGSEVNRELLPIADGPRGFIPEHTLRQAMPDAEKSVNDIKPSQITADLQSDRRMMLHHAIHGIY